MDFVKGQLVRSNQAGRDKTRTLAVLAVEMEQKMLLVADGDLAQAGQPQAQKDEARCTTTTVLENELLKSDQQLRDAIRAYDAAQN